MEENEQVTEAQKAEEVTASKGAASFWSAVRKFFTLQRIAGVLAILVLVLALLPWVSVPTLKSIGINASFSVPGTLKTSTVIIDKAEKVQEAAVKVQEAIAVAKRVIVKTTEVQEGIESVYESQGIEGIFVNVVSGILDGSISDAVEDAQTDLESTATTSTQGTALEQAGKTLSTVHTLLIVGIILWIIGVLLLLIAAILSLIGLRKTKALGIVAFAYSTFFAVVMIVAVLIADSALCELLVDAIGAWVAFIIPNVIAATFWVWASAIISIAGIVLCALTKPGKKQEAPVEVEAAA